MESKVWWLLEVDYHKLKGQVHLLQEWYLGKLLSSLSLLSYGPDA